MTPQSRSRRVSSAEYVRCVCGRFVGQHLPSRKLPGWRPSRVVPCLSAPLPSSTHTSLPARKRRARRSASLAVRRTGLSMNRKTPKPSDPNPQQVTTCDWSKTALWRPVESNAGRIAMKCHRFPQSYTLVVGVSLQPMLCHLNNLISRERDGL